MFGLRIGRLGAVARAVRELFSPSSLFAASEPGVWLDPSDFSTMFQDSAGTTPVTAVEQPVGLMLDKSKGLVLGSELVTNGDFSGGTTGWIAFGSVAPTLTTISGELQVLTNEAAPGGAYQAITTVVGKWYTVAAKIRRGDGVDVRMRAVTSTPAGTLLAESATVTSASATSVTLTFVATSTSTAIYARVNANGIGQTGFFDNVSVRELPGNHAIQTTSTSRPVLSARVNLLTATATLATQTVITRATTQTLRFTGAGTITLSGTATGTFSAGTHSVTTTAGNLTLTVSGTVTEADLRASNMGVGLPAYQAVVNSTTYDTTGFPLYLKFDGVDDFLATNSINFTSTDKMTVFAGVRKLSDAARGVLAELSASTAGNAGAFVLTAPEGATSYYGFGSRGSILNSPAVASPFAAPITNVLTGVGNISGDSAILRVNGAQAAQSTADQGTGNYGNYPLYIGRRGGTTLPFNGHLYSLIVRGAQSNAGQIGNTEQWVNGKTGAY